MEGTNAAPQEEEGEVEARSFEEEIDEFNRMGGKYTVNVRGYQIEGESAGDAIRKAKEYLKDNQ